VAGDAPHRAEAAEGPAVRPSPPPSSGTRASTIPQPAPGRRPAEILISRNEPKHAWLKFLWRFRPPRKLKFTREGKYFLGITLGVGFAAINTGNNLLYLLLGMLL